MKRLAIIAAAVLSLCACNQADVLDSPIKSVTFTLDGDFIVNQEPMTRALEADGKSMTDVWVFDYVGGVLQQQLHQSSTDADFGTITLSLAFGIHRLYFVTSRGRDAVLNTTDATLTFGTVSDTFWADHDVTVSSATASSATVTLNRIVTRLRVSVNDAIPSDAATLNVTPSTWYYGFNYTTAAPCAVTNNRTISVTLPSSVIGTTDVVSSFFGFSSSTQWQTNVIIDSKTSTNAVIGSATVTDVPLARNTTTTVSGNLYATLPTYTMILSSDWGTPIDMTW